MTSKLTLISSFIWLLGFAPTLAAPADDMPLLKPGSTVLLIGDSITDGGRAKTGNDYNHTMGQSYSFIISAQLGYRFAERNLTFINRGIGGNRTIDLAARWQTDVIDLKPDVLSILIGVNDTFWAKNMTFEQFEPTYDSLISQTLAALPNVRIILGEPFLLPVGKFKDDYPAKLAELKKRQEVVARLAAKYKLPLIRYQSLFDEALKRAPADHWCWDGVHPHYAGHALMADAWMKVLGSMK